MVATIPQGMNTMSNGSGTFPKRGSLSMSAEDMAPMWQRMSTMNGSFPSFQPQGNPSSATGSGKGRPSALRASTFDADRRSGAIPNPSGNGAAGGGSTSGSGGSSPQLPSPSDPRSSFGSRSKLSNGPSTSSPKGKSFPSRPPIPGRQQHSSEDEFSPPQAPFAREAALKNRSRNTSSYSSDDSGGTTRRASPLPGGSGSLSSSRTSSAAHGVSSSPSIVVTDHGLLVGRTRKDSSPAERNTIASDPRANSSGTISLNDSVKDKRPQSDIVSSNLKVSPTKEKAHSGGFLATIKRLSMRPSA